MIVNIPNQIQLQGVVFKEVLQAISNQNQQQNQNNRHVPQHWTGTSTENCVFAAASLNIWDYLWYFLLNFRLQIIILAARECLNRFWRVVPRITRKYLVTKPLKGAAKKVLGYLDPDQRGRQLQLIASLKVLFTVWCTATELNFHSAQPRVKSLSKYYFKVLMIRNRQCN